MSKILITERGDAALNYTWEEKLSKLDKNGKPVYQGIVLITKDLNKKLRDTILRYHNSQLFHNKIIVHATCTGWGGTEMEPNVPVYTEQLKNLKALIKAGFPQDHTVLRVDPIIPTYEGVVKANAVLEHKIAQKLADNDILRVRVSILDKYKHVLERIKEQTSEKLESNSFYPTNNEIDLAARVLSGHPEFDFETCAEPKLYEYIRTEYPYIHIAPLGCISEKDLRLMNVPVANNQISGIQRGGCLCLDCKTEALNNRTRCPHGCAYCYWKDK